MNPDQDKRFGSTLVTGIGHIADARHHHGTKNRRRLGIEVGWDAGGSGAASDNAACGDQCMGTEKTGKTGLEVHAQGRSMKCAEL
ncbi:hypothetical protein [Massilia genomosp. 1]|uniref:Uncharacterized protein n=1 Tax=Massilia genomosp. 1 TaxID=2609280 RepID=A0ABX0MPQ1_9BURK|nr:hypothetical protein [Massilia genomosp. 1]NHZ62560.1 hypothetical protein [Massilia genomosp. 1]